MSVIKPSLPSGMRDFSPEQVMQRQYILQTIESVFRSYGFMPLQTPAMENIETLTGKYGDEGDQLIFKVLNSRIHEAKEEKKELMRKDFNMMLESNYNSRNVIEKALRYDLTVPFARYVVMHRNEITFPFRRYQMQPVWRADRPQKGRFREFWQCDADVIGSDSLLNEADLVGIYTDAFAKLNLDVTIHINHRKILMGIAEMIGAPERMMELITVIDTLDKSTWDDVQERLSLMNFTQEQVSQLKTIFSASGDVESMLQQFNTFFTNSESGKKGTDDLRFLMDSLKKMNYDLSRIKLDITLARGLNYYTGCIFEVKSNEVKMGSIGGGGRYDDLTGIFGWPGISGVGISFGLDRIYEVLDELRRFPSVGQSITRVLFCAMDNAALQYALMPARQFREAGINTEVYPMAAKLKKQLDYANAKGVEYAIIIGENEMQTGNLSLKNLTSGEQKQMPVSEIISLLCS